MPPVDTSNQLIVPSIPVAPKVTEPGAQRTAPVTVATEGFNTKAVSDVAFKQKAPDPFLNTTL